VVVMIHAHIIDAWTRPADKSLPLYEWVVRINGMGAPLFLFLAGIAVALGGSAGVRRHGDARRASWALQKRGWEIFGLALLFRVQAWLLSPGATLYGILKVDILNVMGPTIAAAAWLWGRGRSEAGRLVWLAAAALALVVATPWVRTAPIIASWPQWLAWYFQPMPGRFAFFPWSGLLFAGGVAGVVLSMATDETGERRTVGWMAAAGAGLFVAAMTAAYFPPLHGPTEFWSTSASFFFARVGVLLVLVGAACSRMSWRPAAWTPLLQFGHTSLFIYWIHVELAYGVIASPLRGNLPLPWAYVAFLAFTWLMLQASLWKDRFVARRAARRAPIADLRTEPDTAR
jgi:hypothetical protein